MSSATLEIAGLFEGLNARVFGTPSFGSESDSRFAAWSMAEPDHQTRLSEKRLSEFGLAIRVLMDLADLCARRRLQRPLRKVAD